LRIIEISIICDGIVVIVEINATLEFKRQTANRYHMIKCLKKLMAKNTSRK